MSDSDTSGGDRGHPETPETDSSESECDRRENECLETVGNLESQIIALKDLLYYATMDQVKYTLTDVQSGRSQGYLGLLQLLQNAKKAGKLKIILYRDVAQHYSKVAYKLPILLIGPPDIGRQDISQRLLEDISWFAPAVLHTTQPCQDDEEAGEDYHFISQEQFDSDKLDKKFMEYGKFAYHYYGTSLEAIREVVNSGKICLLKVRHDTLQILRVSDLKPLTVFVAFLGPEEHETEESD